jgi:hypothetical protein
MAVLEETGVEYTLHKVDFDAGEAQLQHQIRK